MKNIAIVLAGGTGKRFGSPKPKQFLKLSGMEIFVRSVNIFHGSPYISKTILVMNKDWIEEATKILHSHGLGDVNIVPGGKTRQLSVYNALKSLPENTDTVMLHDAARPLFQKEKIEELLNGLEKGTGTVIVSRVTDTLYLTENNMVDKIPDRDFYRAAQTPQTFFYKEILEAHEKAMDKGILDSTDDVRLFIESGKKVKIIESAFKNIKITTGEDLEIASFLWKKKYQ